MGSLLSRQAPVNLRKQSDLALIHKLECRACPLNGVVGAHMAPTGAARPLVYILGEAPGADEVEEQEQFVGASGQLLRAHIPRRFRDQLRYNNVVRSRPPANRNPERVEIEACRPSITRDIEQTKPKAILGFGNVPLEWVSGFNGITLWRGRKMPVKVGSHTCWYYPMLHPAYLLRQRRHGGPSEEERMFVFDMKRAFAEVENLPAAVVHSPADVRHNVEIITETGATGLAKIKQALLWAARQPVIGVDYETNCLRPYFAKAKILTAAVGNSQRAIAFPFDHPEASWKPTERAELAHFWVRFLKEAGGSKAVHNLAFEMEWSAVFFGDDVLRASRWEDTMTQAGVVDERKGNKKGGPFSLEFLVQQYFGFNLKKMSGLDRSSLEDTPLEAVLQYNAPDARYHALLYEKQAALIKARGLEEAYELGLRAVPTVVLTQKKGLPVDQTEALRLQKKYGTELKATHGEIEQLPVVREFKTRQHKDFNPLSNPDVLYLLKDLLHRPEVSVIDKYTKKPKYSADESVLVQIDHPISQLLLDLRTIHKRKTTYVDPLVATDEDTLIYPDGLLHAQFNTVFAETARLSCETPNLQNFPKRDGEAKEVRKQIVAPPGCVALAFDYGQLEARVIAFFTQDKRFCKALWERYDVHMEWAERLAHAYPSRIGGRKFLTDKKVMKDFRTDIKNQWTFPLFFGARLSAAAGYLKIPEDKLKPHYEEFWRQFSGVKTWQDEEIEFYNEYGYVECLTGRRRHGPMSSNQIFNSPVQGSAAALVIEAMSRLSETGDPELQPEINIHDDFTYMRVPEKRVDIVAEQVITHMLAVPFEWAKAAPITIEMSLGSNWLEMEEVGAYSSDDWGK